MKFSLKCICSYLYVHMCLQQVFVQLPGLQLNIPADLQESLFGPSSFSLSRSLSASVLSAVLWIFLSLIKIDMNLFLAAI